MPNINITMCRANKLLGSLQSKLAADTNTNLVENVNAVSCNYQSAARIKEFNDKFLATVATKRFMERVRSKLLETNVQLRIHSLLSDLACLKFEQEKLRQHLKSTEHAFTYDVARDQYTCNASSELYVAITAFDRKAAETRLSEIEKSIMEIDDEKDRRNTSRFTMAVTDNEVAAFNLQAYVE